MNKSLKKKQKKKGFTLVELLAVIVILAVVMVVTVPTILGSMKQAKEKAFNTSVIAVQNYIDKQVEMCKVDNELLPYKKTIFVKENIDKTCIIDNEKADKILKLVGYENELTNLVIENNKITMVYGKINLNKTII